MAAKRERTVDREAMLFPLCEMLNAFSIWPMDKLKPNGNSAKACQQ